MSQSVPLLDLAPQYATLREQLHAAVLRVMDSQRFVLGDEGRAFEEETARYLGVKHAIGCASGSDALLLGLRALDVGPDQTVVTTPQSFFATVGAPARLGASVDFVDVEEGTLNLDPERLAAFCEGCERGADGVLREPRRGRRVTTLIAVDLFGRPCRYGPLLEVADKYGLAVIEDAAQSFGASLGGRRCGAFGRLGAISFYPTKNLGGAGDGGLITTDDDALAARLRSLRVHGQPGAGAVNRYYHDEVGWNSRLDELQAAVLRVKLPHVDAWNAARREHAAAYDAAFAELDGVRPLEPADDGVEAIYHLYVIRAERRDALKDHLVGRGIGAAVYYPLPLHLQRCFQDLGYRQGDLPIAEAASGEVLALPMFPELTADQRGLVIDAVRSFYRG